MQSHRIMFGLSLLVCFSNFSDALQISPSPRKGPQQLAGFVTHARPSRLAFLALPEEPTMPDHTAAKPERDQDEYRRKLAEAQVAIAAAEEARRRLHPPPPSRPPRSTRAKLSKTDAGTLVLELPPAGLNSGTIFSGAFSIAWFSVVLPATFSGVWLFMLPFWAAGALVAKLAVVDPFVTSKLTIGQYAWSLKSIYGGQNGITLNEKEGATDDLRLARPELIAVVNGMPQYDIKLYDSTGPTSLPMGTQVSEEELEYLVDEINNHLRALQDMPDPELLHPGS